MKLQMFRFEFCSGTMSMPMRLEEEQTISTLDTVCSVISVFAIWFIYIVLAKATDEKLHEFNYPAIDVPPVHSQVH